MKTESPSFSGSGIFPLSMERSQITERIIVVLTELNEINYQRYRKNKGKFL